LIKAGIDCYEAIEYKAGNTLPELFEKFGDQFAYCGNVDIRVLESNDMKQVEEALNANIRPVLNKGVRYIYHSDHSISPKIKYATYCEFLELARKSI
jgi:uroporphyrinogen-III decarboxylase